MGQNILSVQWLWADNRHGSGFIDDTKYHDDILVLWLRDELGNDPDVIQGPLCVGVAHGTIEEVDAAAFPGVVPSVLRSRNSMQIQVDPETIFARPLDALKEIPGHRWYSRSE